LSAVNRAADNVLGFVRLSVVISFVSTISKTNLWIFAKFIADNVLDIGANPLVSAVSGQPQFSVVWCPPICGHPRKFDHLIVN